MRKLMIVCVVLSTVCTGCARNHGAQGQNSSQNARNLNETLRLFEHLDENLQMGVAAQVEHSAGL